MASSQPQRLFDPGPAVRGPKGTRVGDLILAERSVWRVEAIDPTRREAIARLVRGAHALRRFRARRIERVWRAEHRGAEPWGDQPPALFNPTHAGAMGASDTRAGGAAWS